MKRNLTRAAAAALIAVLLLTMGGLVSGAETPEAEPVSHIAYVNGYSDGLFRPGRAMTRAEMAQILYILLPTIPEPTPEPEPDPEPETEPEPPRPPRRPRSRKPRR